MTIKLRILRELNSRKHGVNAHKLFILCEAKNYNSFRAYVSTLATTGEVSVLPAQECPHCGSPNVHYKITPVGKALLAKEPM